MEPRQFSGERQALEICTAEPFACQIDITILYRIKGQVPRNISIVWLHVRDCSESNWQALGIVKSASYLFFLSKQSEWWRPIDDNPRTARVQLHRHGEDVARLVRTEPDPLLALAIVFVFVDANILRITFNENWSHGEMFGGVRSLIGLDSIPLTLSRVFHSANEDGRQAICFLASDFGMCLGCVARYLYGHRDRDLWEPVIRHREETIKKELRPSTVRALEVSVS